MITDLNVSDLFRIEKYQTGCGTQKIPQYFQVNFNRLTFILFATQLIPNLLP